MKYVDYVAIWNEYDNISIKKANYFKNEKYVWTILICMHIDK